VLESLAAGKAVVTTPLAAEGLDVADGVQLFIAKTDAEFVERILYLLRNENERLALASRARTWACEHITWDHSISKYEILYRELIGESMRSSTDDVDNSEFGGLQTRSTVL
jgi:glycosyltransferase involved in cell wall biosynthesis